MQPSKKHNVTAIELIGDGFVEKTLLGTVCNARARGSRFCLNCGDRTLLLHEYYQEEDEDMLDEEDEEYPGRRMV